MKIRLTQRGEIALITLTLTAEAVGVTVAILVPESAGIILAISFAILLALIVTAPVNGYHRMPVQRSKR